MFIKKIFAIIVVSAMMVAAATAQGRLQLKDTIADEKGNMRYFALDSASLLLFYPC